MFPRAYLLSVLQSEEERRNPRSEHRAASGASAVNIEAHLTLLCLRKPVAC
jgi:hypothetical protein